jgi:hypothetical protein
MMAIAFPKWAHKQTLTRAMGTSVLAPKNRRTACGQSVRPLPGATIPIKRADLAGSTADRSGQVTTIEVDPLLSMRQTEFLAVALCLKLSTNQLEVLSFIVR